MANRCERKRLYNTKKTKVSHLNSKKTSELFHQYEGSYMNMLLLNLFKCALQWLYKLLGISGVAFAKYSASCLAEE